ncbi:MAG: hypothetical protein ACE14L_17915 [Terriglobales bacterium]
MKHAFLILCCSVAHLVGAEGLTVTSGVTFEPGLPYYGGIASAFVVGVKVTGIVTAAAPLPMSIADVTVDVCGSAAPLYAVADLGGYQQINFQVPWESRLVSDGFYVRCLVTVRQGAFQVTQNAYVRDRTSADLFFTREYIGLFQHGSDYSPVTREHPALPGEVVILYAAALPQTDPPVPAGAASPFSPLAVVQQYASVGGIREVTLQFDSAGGGVRPLFVGLAPGHVGLYQLNFQVPETLTPGDHVLRVVIGWCGAFHGTGCTAPSSIKLSNPVILPVGS